MQKKITLYYVTDADVERPDPDSLNKWVESFESSNGNIPLDIRQKWASKDFAMTNAYESSIYNYL